MSYNSDTSLIGESRTSGWKKSEEISDEISSGKWFVECRQYSARSRKASFDSPGPGIRPILLRMRSFSSVFSFI